jgi:aldehyde:ferredoxin oxidoreductase
MESCSIGLEADELRSLLGGTGLGTYLLLRHLPPQVDPLSDRSSLVVALSPLVGSPFTTSAKFALVGKSPLTDRLCDALCSSSFALAAKRTGYDAFVITGQAPECGVLVVDDCRVRLEPAKDWWGWTIPQAEEAIRQRLGPSYQALVIGPAGENRVRYATVSHDGRHAGRGGLGAVLGAKRLKGIAVAGSRDVRLAAPEAAGRLARDLSARSLGTATAKYRQLGTVANVLILNRLAALPSRNFQHAVFDEAERISGEQLVATRWVGRRSCAACTIGCEQLFRTPSGPVRLEYETLYALGAACGISDPDVILQAARRCDELGLDTISTGVNLAFAMECVERGWLPWEDLKFGGADALLGWIEEIATRRGRGALLADGVKRLAERLGPPAQRVAPHVKGLEMPGYEPRSFQMMGLGFAVSTRGADHNRSSAYQVDVQPGGNRLCPDEKAVEAAVEAENRAAVLDSMILCKFLRHALTDFYADCAAMLRCVTGWDVSPQELQATAAHIVTLKKLFNIREGWTPEEDTLPDRFFQETIREGPARGAVLDRQRFERLKRCYYLRRGWTAEGYVPAAAMGWLREGLHAAAGRPTPL